MAAIFFKIELDMERSLVQFEVKELQHRGSMYEVISSLLEEYLPPNSFRVFNDVEEQWSWYKCTVRVFDPEHMVLLKMSDILSRAQYGQNRG